MTYTPTKEELEELKFYPIEEYWEHYVGGMQNKNRDEFTIQYSQPSNSWYFEIISKIYPNPEEPIIESHYGGFSLNIKSIEDIKTLIRLLTPQ